LHTLQQIGLIKRTVPVTEDAPHKSKKGVYQISGYYLRFWFLYVLPYQSDIAMGSTGWLIDKIKKEYSHFMGPVFEDICRQLILRLFPGAFQKIGSWWNKHSEIDIVCLNPEKRTVLLGECKWANKPVGKDVTEHLIEQSKKIDVGFHAIRTSYIVFSKSGFTEEAFQCHSETLTLVDLRELSF